MASFKYDNADEGVGYQNFSGWSRKRLFYGFDTSGLKNAIVLDAKFSTFEVFAGTCSLGTVNAYATRNAVSSTTWNTQPSRTSGVLSTFSTKAGRPECLPGRARAAFDVTAAVKARVATNAAVTTIQLAGASETTGSSWMRFASPVNTNAASGPTLLVTYTAGTTTSTPRG